MECSFPVSKLAYFDTEASDLRNDQPLSYRMNLQGRLLSIIQTDKETGRGGTKALKGLSPKLNQYNSDY
jgi:hypothetical protein